MEDPSPYGLCGVAGLLSIPVETLNNVRILKSIVNSFGTDILVTDGIGYPAKLVLGKCFWPLAY